MPKEQPRLHLMLAIATFLILCVMGVLGGLEWYSVGYQTLTVFGFIFLVLMGYGALAQSVLERR